MSLADIMRATQAKKTTAASTGPTTAPRPASVPTSAVAFLKSLQKAPAPPSVPPQGRPSLAALFAKPPEQTTAVSPVGLKSVMRTSADASQRPDLVSETIRIVSLPLVDYFGCDLTEQYKRPGAQFPFTDASGSVIERLNEAQSAMLAAMEACNGGLFPAGVGHGKAGAALLAPTALGAELAIILTTSGTLNQLRKTYGVWRRYFRLVDNVHILSYDQLSTQSGTTLLDDIAKGVPDHKIVIVADEAHKIRAPDSARTKRVLRFFDGDLKEGTPGHYDARFVALSGTMTSKSLRDFSHLARLALRHMSPVPCDEHDLDAWAECIDVDGQPGDLQWRRLEPLWTTFADTSKPMSDMRYEERREAIRKAFQRRLRSCPGVVATEEQAIGCSLIITARTMGLPKTIKEAMRAAELDGVDPTGEPLPDDISVSRINRQLSAGFYYIWDWPYGEVDLEWMKARQRYHALVRIELQANAAAGYDSEFLVSSRVAHQLEQGRRDAIHIAWRHWSEQKQKRWQWPDGSHRPHPPTKTIWVDKFFVEEAVSLAKSIKEPAILWYESRALQEALRENGIDVRGAGEDAPSFAKLCALSTRAHGDGLNLQAWTRNVILEPMSSGQRWEQVLGRSHRPGQDADEIFADVFQHTDTYRRSVQQAREDARYIEGTSGNKQKLNYATLIGFDERKR